jgi:CRISPR-associated protein Csd1
MILHALNHYYERLRDDPDIDIPLLGFGNQKIHFALVLDKSGKLLQVRDIREMGKNGKPVPTLLTVPTRSKRRTSGLEANFLWDNTAYALGADAEGEKTESKFSTFRALHRTIAEGTTDEGIQSIVRFLDGWDPAHARSLDHWEEMAGKNIVFQLDGETRYIHDRPAAQQAWTDTDAEEEEVKLTCLMCGEVRPVARLHPPILGFQSTGISIASFNRSAFESYNKEQNFNSPMSHEAAFNYTTALNHLLRFESRQRIRVGDTTVVFWTERASPIEAFMGVILDPREDAGDLSEVRLLLEAARDGTKLPDIGDKDMNFYILGLSPNMARLSVRFWHVSTVEDITRRVGEHFRDLSIVRGPKDPQFPALWQLLRETAPQGKMDNVPPLLAGTLMRAILGGTAYPHSLLSLIIGRIRADHTINYIRAAMIKAYLNRIYRLAQSQKEVTMSLDRESTNIPYRLGRLFAVLEKAQKDAIPGANATIKDRYYGSASATPSVVFPQLLRMAQHHVQKAEYGSRTDKMIEEVMEGIVSFPAHLLLDDQGMFAIGYYHQRQAFYTKQKNVKEE